MIDDQRIGCGIVTYNRPAQLRKLYDSLPHHLLDHLVIINDGAWYSEFSEYHHAVLIHNDTNLGVGKSKNKALSLLIEQQCDHFFLIEDDIFIKDPAVFELYILTSKLTGIQHLNYSQHGVMNRTPSGDPQPVINIDYGQSINLPLYRHCVGAFSYYSKMCLERAGLMDEEFHNALEHVDHTLAIINHHMHPPFWFFADISDSHLYLGDELWSVNQSTLASNVSHRQNVLAAMSYFEAKHGHMPLKYPMASNQELIESLTDIKLQWGLPL